MSNVRRCPTCNAEYVRGMFRAHQCPEGVELTDHHVAEHFVTQLDETLDINADALIDGAAKAGVSVVQHYFSDATNDREIARAIAWLTAVAASHADLVKLTVNTLPLDIMPDELAANLRYGLVLLMAPPSMDTTENRVDNVEHVLAHLVESHDQAHTRIGELIGELVRTYAAASEAPDGEATTAKKPARKRR